MRLVGIGRDQVGSAKADGYLRLINMFWSIVILIKGAPKNNGYNSGRAMPSQSKLNLAVD